MLAASLGLNACLKVILRCSFFGGALWVFYLAASTEPLPLFYVQKIRLCGCFILQLALSLDVPYPRKMSEKRGEVIVPAGRRYQQKQHELLPQRRG